MLYKLLQAKRNNAATMILLIVGKKAKPSLLFLLILYH